MAMPTASKPELEQPPARFFQHPILGPLTLQQGKLSSSTEQGSPSTVVEQDDSLTTSVMDSLYTMAGTGWAAAPEEVPPVSDVDATPTPSELSNTKVEQSVAAPEHAEPLPQQPQAHTGAAPDEEEEAFLIEQILQVPVVGKYANALLQHRWLKPFVQKADPYLQEVCQRPIVQGSIKRLSPIVVWGIHKAEDAISAIQQIPGVVIAVPGQVLRGAQAAPGQTYRGITAAPGHACQAATPYATAVADRTQPYVHKGVNFLTPFVKSVLGNPRVQSVYQKKIVQDGVHKALPYVKPVMDNSRVQAVQDWARPRASSI
jgi:hypothetical protein